MKKERQVNQTVQYLSFGCLLLYLVIALLFILKNDDFLIKNMETTIENNITFDYNLQEANTTPLPDNLPPHKEEIPKNEDNIEKEEIPKEEIPKNEDNIEKEEVPIEEVRIGDNANLKNLVELLNVVGIGDSIMLGAVANLKEIFPNGYFDGKVSRQIWHGIDVINQIKALNKLGNPVVVNLGANGNCSYETKVNFLKALGNRDIFWLTVNNNDKVQINDSIKALTNDFPNLHIIDWETISKGHTEYFYGDGIHLDIPGRIAYSNAIYNAIYELYSQKFPNLQ